MHMCLWRDHKSTAYCQVCMSCVLFVAMIYCFTDDTIIVSTKCFSMLGTALFLYENDIIFTLLRMNMFLQNSKLYHVTYM